MKKILLILITLLSVNFAFAHERQVMNIGGSDFLFTIGSLNESIVVGDKTGIDLKVTLADPSDYGTTTTKVMTPVLGLEKTLKVENISKSGVKKVFELAAAWGKPGNYTTLFYPTSSEEFSYRLLGTINGEEVDLKFTCNELGHVMNMGTGAADEPMVMKNGKYDVKFHSGSFGCPKEKEELMFPGKSKLNDALMNNAFGIIALALVIGYIVQNRRK